MKSSVSPPAFTVKGLELSISISSVSMGITLNKVLMFSTPDL